MPKFKPVKALQKGMTLLEYLAQHANGCDLKELALHLGCSTPAAFHLVQTLVAGGYVDRQEKPVRYFTGNGLLKLTAEHQHKRLDQRIEMLLLNIHKDLPGSSVYFTESQNGHIVITRQISRESNGQVQDNLSDVLQPYTSAGSLIHLSFWSEEQRKRYVDRHSFDIHGSALWGDYENFSDAMDKARKDTFYFLESRSKCHLRAGIPIYKDEHELYGSITVQWDQSTAAGLNNKKRFLIEQSFKQINEIWEK